MSVLTYAIASDDEVDAADAQNIGKRKGRARTRPLAPIGGYGYSAKNQIYSKHIIE